MDGQNAAPNQADDSTTANNANVSSNNKTATALLNDPIFKAIHNAFLLGWSIMELKSRVQINACNLALDSITFDKESSTFIANVLDYSPPEDDEDTWQAQPNLIDSVLKNIVLKDVARLQDLDSKDGTKPLTSTAQSLPTELRDNAWLTSELRSIFQRIVTLHIGRFPGSDVTDTVYDINPPWPKTKDKQPDDSQNQQEPFPYPYLYPGKFDYTNVGMSLLKKSNITGSATIDDFVANFRIYDVTRRALNSLTLLLTTAEESLEPATIECYQRRLVPKVLAAPPLSTKPGESQQKPPAHEGGAEADTVMATDPALEAGCEELADVSDHDMKRAIKKLSNIIIRLLEAWDGFLRESFYVDTDSPNSEIELAAYGAGRSLAALSWGVSVAIVPLENTVTPELLNNSEFENMLTNRVRSTWMNVFNDRDVNHIQYQIAALSTALDEAYYRVNTNIKPPSAGDALVTLNPDLPSQAISTVRHSLDYWERTVVRMCSSDGTIRPLLAPMPAGDQPQTGTLALASKQDSGSRGVINHAPTGATAANTKNQSATAPMLPSKLLNLELSKTLRTELVQQSSVWLSLILYQQGLQSFTANIVSQKIVNDFMQEFEQIAKDEIFKNNELRWTLVIVGAVVILILLLVVVGALQSQAMTINQLINNPLVFIAAIGAALTPLAGGVISRVNRLGGLFGSAGTTISEAFESGYKRVLIEFDYLNYNVAITYPLIEFFLWHQITFGGNPIEDGYDFLIHVFWTEKDREEELQQVARAAFGPIGAFVGAHK